MLLSMTGFGAATHQAGDALFTVEVRTVNNRFLKVISRLPESCVSLDGQVERAVRDRIGRGTVNVFVRIHSRSTGSRSLADEGVIADYAEQFRGMAERLGLSGELTLDSLLSLPGVIRDDNSRTEGGEHLWPGLEVALQEALEELATFRTQEGATIEADLGRQCEVIGTELEAVRLRSPKVAEAYRQKLLERVGTALAGTAAKVSETDVIREVSLFADRCDINEELSRMDAHLVQFRQILDADSSEGRKLDFLAQEMFRETNTIGSKANDVEIAHRVVEIKLAIERIRENLQNVE